MASIPISGLNSLGTVTADDFFPVVDSGSLTTFRTTMLTIANYMSGSGTASYALRAGSSSVAITSSFAGTASSAASASFLVFPNTSTASYSSYATSASAAISASYARNATNSASSSFSLFTISSSYARTSSFAVTASALTFPINSVPFATASLSASWASSSISASYSIRADTASFAINSTVRAFAEVLWTGSGGDATAIFLSASFNIQSVRFLFSTTNAPLTYDHFGIKFINPVTSTNYMFHGYATSGGTGGNFALFATTRTIPSLTHKTVNGFTASIIKDQSYNSFYYSGITFPLWAFEVFGS